MKKFVLALSLFFPLGLLAQTCEMAVLERDALEYIPSSNIYRVGGMHGTAELRLEQEVLPCKIYLRPTASLEWRHNGPRGQFWGLEIEIPGKGTLHAFGPGIIHKMDEDPFNLFLVKLNLNIRSGTGALASATGQIAITARLDIRIARPADSAYLDILSSKLMLCNWNAIETRFKAGNSN